MKFNLTSKDNERLKRAHPDLKKVILRAAEITKVPFTVLQSDRTLEQQRENVRKGVSQTMKSRHLISPDGFVRAVDIAPLDGKGASFAWPLYHKLAPHIKQAAKDVDIPIEWGGDWRTFKDGPHWQLPWSKYP
jgi:peptidoglycan LD-endopeptidase CwlK